MREVSIMGGVLFSGLPAPAVTCDMFISYFSKVGVERIKKSKKLYIYKKKSRAHDVLTLVPATRHMSHHTHTHHPAIHTTHSYLIPATGTLASGPRPQK